MKKYFVVFLMVLFVMGCTQQQEEEEIITYNGLVVTSFVPGIDSLMPGESTDLSMVIQNLGDFEATNIETKLLGLGQMDSRPVNEESRPNEMSPDVREQLIWDLTAPSLAGFKSEIPFTIQGIVYFHYSSVSWADAAIVPSGDSSRPRKENGTSSSPVSMELSTSPEVIRTYKDPTPFFIKIVIENRGGGSIAYYGEGSEYEEKSNYMETIMVRVPSDWEIMDDTWKEHSDSGGWATYMKTMEGTTITEIITDCEICGCPQGYTYVNGDCVSCPEGFSLDKSGPRCFRRYCDDFGYELVSTVCCPEGWDYDKIDEKCTYSDPELGEMESDPVSPQEEEGEIQTIGCECSQQRTVEGSMDNQLRLTGGSSKTIYIPFSIPETNISDIQRFYVNASYGYKVSSSTTTINVMPENY